ncbi:MAG: sigma-70 family RNA polymerase sigma factor [Lysobacterales bacterium]
MTPGNDQPGETVAEAIEADCADLIARIGSRELRALDQLYDATVDKLHALAARVAGDPRDAEEVVADVYQYVWEHHAQFDASRGNGMAWLSMLTWSRASDRRRRRKPESSLEALHPEALSAAYTACEENSGASEMEAFVEGHRVRLALAGLRSEQRQLLLMAFFEGSSHAEIAERTGIPLGTVKSHIRRGMDCLRVELEPGAAHG